MEVLVLVEREREKKNPGLHLYSQTLGEGAISCLIN